MRGEAAWFAAIFRLIDSPKAERETDLKGLSIGLLGLAFSGLDALHRKT